MRRTRRNSIIERVKTADMSVLIDRAMGEKGRRHGHSKSSCLEGTGFRLLLEGDYEDCYADNNVHDRSATNASCPVHEVICRICVITGKYVTYHD